MQMTQAETITQKQPREEQQQEVTSLLWAGRILESSGQGHLAGASDRKPVFWGLGYRETAEGGPIICILRQ
jgi:hypothetical protein